MKMTENRLILHNLQFFDGLTNRLHKGKNIVIKGKNIKSVESQTNSECYSAYEMIDLGGLTVLPGLIDNHVHITNSFMPRISLENPESSRPTLR